MMRGMEIRRVERLKVSENSRIYDRGRDSIHIKKFEKEEDKDIRGHSHDK